MRIGPSRRLLGETPPPRPSQKIPPSFATPLDLGPPFLVDICVRRGPETSFVAAAASAHAWDAGISIGKYYLFSSERWLSGRKRLIRNQVWAQAQRGFDSHSLLCVNRPPTGNGRRRQLNSLERCPSGRRGTIGNRVHGNVPRVPIPLSPPALGRGPRDPHGRGSHGTERGLPEPRSHAPEFYGAVLRSS